MYVSERDTLEQVKSAIITTTKAMNEEDPEVFVDNQSLADGEDGYDQLHLFLAETDETPLAQADQSTGSIKELLGRDCLDAEEFDPDCRAELLAVFEK